MGAVSALWRGGSVRDARRALHGCALSANWVLADRAGGIAVQQTGALPLRARSGLCPLPAWERDTLWRGFVPGSDLAYVEDPPEGFVVTANDDWNPPGGPLAVNLSMGSTRAARIRELLSGGGERTLEDLKAMQRDLVSLHARAILGMVWPHLPETPAGDLLRAWDGQYDAASKAAVLFERLYAGLKDEVFGKRMFGERLWAAIGDTVLTHEFFPIFDRVLLDGDEKLFFGRDGRAGVVGRVARRIAEEDPARVPAWGELNTITMTNVFFQGRLPKALGFDAGPFPIEGGRASIVQGQVLTAAGRRTSFAPSWRYVTDMGTDQVETALPGGPSDRRVSRWYTSDLGRWRRYEYKTLRGRAR
jgi:penicillin amidase